MILKRFLCCLLLGFIAAPVAWSADFIGKCVGVVDGGTLDVLHAGRTERVRLDGINVPSLKQAFGPQARQALANCVADKMVSVKDKGRDKAGCTLGFVFNMDNWNVNATLVRNGFAWVAAPPPADPRLAVCEAVARREKKGLWKSITPAELGLSRNDSDDLVTSASLAALRSPADDVEQVYITSFGKKYHTFLCEYATSQKTPVNLANLPPDYEPCPMCNPPLLNDDLQLTSATRSVNTHAISAEERLARQKLVQEHYRNRARGVAARSASAGFQPALTVIEEPELDTGERTATGFIIYTGPRGDRYHYSKNGTKVYEKQKK